MLNVTVIKKYFNAGGEKQSLWFQRSSIDNELIDMGAINCAAELRSNVNVSGLRGDKGCIIGVCSTNVFSLERIRMSDANRMYNKGPILCKTHE